MNIQPMHNKLFVVPDEAEEKSKGGIILTDYTKKRPCSGVVIAVGPKVKEIKVGDRIVYGEYPWERQIINEKETFIFTEEDIIAKEVTDDSNPSV